MFTSRKFKISLNLKNEFQWNYTFVGKQQQSSQDVLQWIANPIPNQSIPSTYSHPLQKTFLFFS
jgi:hypothetical protein